MSIPYQCITDTATLRVKRLGYTPFVAGSNETLTVGLSTIIPGEVPLKYLKVSGLTLVEMTGPEQIVVNLALFTESNVNSTEALTLNQVYADAAALPAVPARDFLLVALDGAIPGLAISRGTQWFPINATVPAPS